jgi:hypothetical protein
MYQDVHRNIIWNCRKCNKNTWIQSKWPKIGDSQRRWTIKWTLNTTFSEYIWLCRKIHVTWL